MKQNGIILSGLSISLAVLFFSCSENENTTPELNVQKQDTVETKKQPDTVSVDELMKLMEEPGYVALDVRNSVAYETKNVPNSLNLNFKSALFKENILHLDKDMTYLVVSDSDEESGKAAEVLKSTGFKTIFVKNGEDAFK
ncbi:MAG TPA: rhodanese-like domain-containing protein [Ignavibacteria bacterium]|nr:rhodanese-like domain-containing protein [Ignavibacteria bacterium]